MSRLRTPLLALLVVVTLAACAPTPPPPPVVGVPSTTPTVAKPVVFTVVLTPSAVTLLSRKGATVDSFDYANPDATPLVAALNKAFGTDVRGVVQETETLYSWDGLQLQDFADGDEPARSGTRINVVKPTVACVDVQVVGGVGIGSPSADVEPLASRTSIESSSGIDVRVFSIGDQQESDPVVTLWADEPDGHVFNIIAGQTGF